MGNRLKDALESGEFVVTCEVIPGRGAWEKSQIAEFAEAERLFATGRVHAISVTDNPGGNPALLADTFAADFLAKGITPIVHVSCKDRNRNQLQSQLYAMERQGIENIFAMTGDYPVSGYGGRARPVFDLDPVQVLKMITAMNQGLVQRTPRGETRDQPCSFFAGAVVSPFKWTEAETITQYLKLEKKLVAGARFAISQIGYDARKMQELIWYLRDNGYQTPVIANIYLCTLGAARLMSRGGIPGCYLDKRLLALIEEETKTADKGQAARHLRAAKLVAIARGLGYAGVHIGGMGLSAEVLNCILDTADELQGRWEQLATEFDYGQADGFYCYQPELDAQGQPTGLNAHEPAPRTEVRREHAILKTYGLSRFFHYWILTQGKRGYKMLEKVMDWRERKKGLHRSHGFEHLPKTMLYGCLDCGDCGLEPAVYTCPMTQCPKCQRNGPCGGSMNGWCEVYPNERYCIHFKAYHRLKKYNELHKLDAYITPPNNWDFYETSAWSNYTHKRDNTAFRLSLPDDRSDPVADTARNNQKREHS